VTQTILTLLSALIWWVLYSSAAAIVPAVLVYAMLRMVERTPVVFNRAYFASLLWTLFGIATAALVLLGQKSSPATGYALFASPWMRGALILDMLAGVLLVWRLVPRVDARRVRITSACMAVAAVTVVALVLGTILASR
jgi:hypothetical protein